jgi:hypothetical protein
MAAQGEKTVYGSRSQLGKICLFNLGLSGRTRREKRPLDATDKLQ